MLPRPFDFADLLAENAVLLVEEISGGNGGYGNEEQEDGDDGERPTGSKSGWGCRRSGRGVNRDCPAERDLASLEFEGGTSWRSRQVRSDVVS